MKTLGRQRNWIFVAREFLSLGNGAWPGYGVFDRPVMLTAEDAPTPSTWDIPAWLDPTQGGVGMTYHPASRRLGDGLVLAAARGQEFVADSGEREDARKSLILAEKSTVGVR